MATETYTDKLTYSERVAEAAGRDADIITQILPVRLSDAEVLDVSRRAAETFRQRGFAEMEKKEAMAEFKGRIEALEREIHELQGIVSSQIEYRTIQCEKTTHRDLGEVVITRLDTGKIIETRPMTAKERQTEMEL